MKSFVHLRGQGSTEYIIVLAIALSLALVVLSVSGLFPSLSYDWQMGDSASYWASAARPLAIIDFTQTNSYFQAVLENKASTNLHLSSLRLTSGGADYTNASLPLLPPGGRATIRLAAPSCSGRHILEYQIELNYSTDQVSALTQTGAKPLYVQCTD